METPNEILSRSALARCQAMIPHDAELTLHVPKQELELATASESLSSIATVEAIFKKYAERPCLGTRAWEVDTNGRLTYLPRFKTMTYGATWQRIQALATGLAGSKLAETGTFVGICGFGSPDWLVTDFACMYLAAVSVPLQTTLTVDDLQHIINETELPTLACSSEQLELIQKVLPQCPTVQHLILIDINPRDRVQAQRLAAPLAALRRTLDVRILSELEDFGASLSPRPYAVPGRDTADANPLLKLMYTSGSTGRPKGAMYVESLMVEHFRGSFGRHWPTIPVIGVAYLPLNHVAGLMTIYQSLTRGGVVQFVLKSDMSTLFEDIRLAQPTFLMLVPRVSEMIFQHFQSEVIKRCGPQADASQQENVRQEVMQSMRRSFLGSRLCFTMSGTAPTANNILDFMRACFDVPVFNGYGATENGGVTFEDHIMREHVTDYKLIDVPELGYTTADKPHPRGELLVKTPRVIPGYFKRPEGSLELHDAEGFMHTGDIVEELGPDHVVWIDRKRNILKLSQGEFVSVSHLEGMYGSKSPYIGQIYVYGNSLRAYLLAVVVPNMQALADLGAGAHNANAIKAALRAEITRVAKSENVPNYEVPRDFIVEMTPFTKENGLLTESNKPSRPRLKAAYGPRLEALYEEIEARALTALRALKGQDVHVSLMQKVSQALVVTLGLGDTDTQDTNVSFIKLGGDSLSAVRLSEVLQEICDVNVPVGALLDPSLTIKALIQRIERQQKQGSTAVTFASIHGKEPAVAHADDLTLARFMPEAWDNPVAPIPASALPEHAHTVFLTGANGFLGRFLLLELLTQVKAADGYVACVVRAPDDATAMHRLRDGYAQSGDQLLGQFDKLSANERLRVYAGDLTQSKFGLTEAVYNTLASDVDCIVHNGALVNHAFTYEQLFEPNVLGTVEVMRLAIAKRIKTLNFVSTVGVVAGVQRPDAVSEQEDAALLWKDRPLGEGYAVGYGASKWACEVLLRELHDKLGVPTKIFRCSMIMAHRSYLGQVNATDLVTRLLCGIIDTGLAPVSFFTDQATHRHFDGTPVDVVAQSIAAIAAHRDLTYSTYHVVNSHWDDDVSLDSFVDWVESAGYTVTRVADYGSWFNQFKASLEKMTGAQRQHSPLALLQQWQQPIGAAVTRLDAQQFRHARQQCIGTADVPTLDEAYMHHYLQDMVHLGLIPAVVRDRFSKVARAVKGASASVQP